MTESAPFNESVSSYIKLLYSQRMILVLHSWNTLLNVQQCIDLPLALEPLKRIYMHYRLFKLMTEFAPYNETAPVDVNDSLVFPWLGLMVDSFFFF